MSVVKMGRICDAILIPKSFFTKTFLGALSCGFRGVATLRSGVEAETKMEGKDRKASFTEAKLTTLAWVALPKGKELSVASTNYQFS